MIMYLSANGYKIAWPRTKKKKQQKKQDKNALSCDNILYLITIQKQFDINYIFRPNKYLADCKALK